MPSQPETVRVYSGRRLVSRIEPMIGATAFIACTRPSAVSRSKRRMRGAHRELEHRHGVVDEGAHRGVPLGDAQLARVHAVGLDGDERLRGPALVLAERLHRGLLAGGVAVEGEDDARLRAVGLVAHDPAQDLDVVDAEGRAAGGHRALDPGRWAAMTSV